MTTGRKLAWFGAVSVLCVALPVLHVLRSPPGFTAGFHDDALQGGGTLPGPLAAAGRVFFRHTQLDENYSRLLLADTGEMPAKVVSTPLLCERVHFAGGRGICLTAERRVLTVYRALLLDADFKIRHTLPLTGIPSRARVSPDGRLGAFTVFESGHSYSSGSFSTRTSIVDLEKGTFVLATLESLSVLRDGSKLESADINFWGVTFARDSSRFFASLGTSGNISLIEGDVARQEARVVRDGVECPALSPDNTRVAFKKRKGGRFEPVSWRLTVLHLNTAAEVELAETRSVDDQVDWLDDHNILYALPELASGSAVFNTWTVPADGLGAPQLVRSGAHSLGILRD